MARQPGPPAPRLAAVSAVLPATPEHVWALVADVRNHARWVPFTRIDVPDDGAPAKATGTGTGTSPGAAFPLGATFTAVSGPGARRGLPGLPDRMLVTFFSPPAAGTPGEAVYRKLGPVLLGTAGVRVDPVATPPGPEPGTGDATTGASPGTPSSSRLTWTEDVHLRGLPRALTAPLLRPVLAVMLRVVLARLRRELG